MMKNSLFAFLLTLLLLPMSGSAQSLPHEELLINYKMESVETEGDAYTEVTVSYLQPAKIPSQFEVRFSIWQEPDCLRPFVRVADGKGVNVDWNRLACVLINVDKEQPEPVGGYAMDEERCWVLPYYAVRRTNKQAFKVRFSPDAFTPKVKGDVRQVMERNHLLRFCAHTFLRVDLYTLDGTLITNRPSTTPPVASSCWEADGWIPGATEEKQDFILGDMGNGPALGPVKLGWRLADVPEQVEGLYDRWIRRVEKENDPAVDEADQREWVTLLYYDQEHRPVLESNVVDDRIISFHVLPSATNVVTTNGVRLGSSVADYQKRFGNPMWVVSREEGKAETYYQDAFTFCTDLKNVYTRTDGANINKFKPGAVISRIEYAIPLDKVKDVPAPPKPIGTYTTTITAGTQNTGNQQGTAPEVQGPPYQPTASGETTGTPDDSTGRKIIPVPGRRPNRDDSPSQPTGQPIDQPAKDSIRHTPVPDPTPDPIPIDTIPEVHHAVPQFNIFDFAQRMRELNDYEKAREAALARNFESDSKSKTSFYGKHRVTGEFFSIDRLTKKNTDIFRLEICVNKRDDDNIIQELKRLGYVQEKVWQEDLLGKPVYFCSFLHKSGQYRAVFERLMGVKDWVRTVKFEMVDR